MLTGADGVPGADVGTVPEEDADVEAGADAEVDTEADADELTLGVGLTEDDVVREHAASKDRSTNGKTR